MVILEGGEMMVMARRKEKKWKYKWEKTQDLFFWEVGK
jgi:hypothetical protein